MKRRFVYILTYFLILLIVFGLQKVFFMAVNDVPMGNCLEVLRHGLSLDITTACYLLSVPFLLTAVTLFLKRFPFVAVIKGYSIIIAILLGVIIISDAYLYTFWQFKLDATALFYLQSPGEAFASISLGYLTLRLLMIVAISFAIGFALCRLTMYFGKDMPMVRCHWSLRILSVILGGGIIFLCIRGGVSESTSNPGQVYFSTENKLNHSAVNPAFNLFYSLGKQQDFSQTYHNLDDKQCDKLFAEIYTKHPSDSTTFILRQKRPNVLIIIMEGIGDQFIQSLGGVPDATPNLDKLISESTVFTNCYANSFRTDRGVVCALSGYLGMPTTSIMKMADKAGTLPSIAKTLRANGYKTSFLYGGDINFTNMQGYLRSTGYETLVSKDDFSLEEQHSNAWGVQDHITFDYLYREMICKQNMPQSKPWLLTFLTLSSHEPYIVPYHRMKTTIEENAVAYTDDCIGKLITQLKQNKALWDNLLIVILSDHGRHYPSTQDYTTPSQYKIPLIFAGGAVNGNSHFDFPINQSDLSATLLTQMGLNAHEFTFSRNVLSHHYRQYACFTFTDGFGAVSEQGIVTYDFGSHKVLNRYDNPSDTLLNYGLMSVQAVYNDIAKR